VVDEHVGVDSPAQLIDAFGGHPAGYPVHGEHADPTHVSLWSGADPGRLCARPG
jgi:hypothetical protein